MKPRVLVARELFEPAMTLLSAHAELDTHTDSRPLSKQELISRLPGAGALVCQLTQQVDADVIAAGKDLRIIANVAVGFDNIDLEAATARGIAVTNTPGVLDDTTADFVWAMILGLARRLTEGDRLVRSRQWSGWDLMQLTGADVHGKTLGIFGLGRIGRRVARRAAGFGMRTLYHNRNRLDLREENDVGVEWAERDALLQRSDFVVLQLPLTPATRHFIGARELAAMKPGAYLINASRGPVVDEAALVGALRSRQIAGAALDVYENEPEIHPGLLDLPNLLLAPHIASASVETRTRMAMMAAENVVAVLKGERPPNQVNETGQGSAA